MSPDVDPATALATIGQTLPYMRPHDYKGSFVYRHPLPGLANNGALWSGATLLASVNFVIEKGGTRSLARPGGLPEHQDNVRRFDAQIGIETDRWSAIARGSNILDADYETWSFYRNANARSPWMRIADPAYYSVEFSWRLGS